jgi:hypothetical protein
MRLKESANQDFLFSILVFWVVIPCGLTGFGGIYYIYTSG